jgi:hypothetical protein
MTGSRKDMDGEMKLPDGLHKRNCPDSAMWPNPYVGAYMSKRRALRRNPNNATAVAKQDYI